MSDWCKQYGDVKLWVPERPDPDARVFELQCIDLTLDDALQLIQDLQKSVAFIEGKWGKR